MGRQRSCLCCVKGGTGFSPTRVCSQEPSGAGCNLIPTSTGSVPASPGSKPRGTVRKEKKPEQQFDRSDADPGAQGADCCEGMPGSHLSCSHRLKWDEMRAGGLTEPF